jgi:DNA-binding transcriptional regulator LsrR (DeoR family)
MSRTNEMRLMVKIARMYYVHGLRQQEITGVLGVHQSTISRMLKRARQTNVVRMVVDIPRDVFSELEEALEQHYGLREAIVVDCPDDEGHMIRELGAAAAFHLESTLRPKMTIGISSWSRHLLSMVEQLHPTHKAEGGAVVQILGGVGTPSIQAQATNLTHQLSRLIGASPLLLQAPGVAGSAKIRDLLLQESYIRDTIASFSTLDVALVGIGALKPSSFLESSGNSFTSEELESLRNLGAVGDICMRYFSETGAPIRSILQNRVVGIDLPELKRVNRVVGIAGGASKFRAIKAAVTGKLINVLITDQKTASKLLKS